MPLLKRKIFILEPPPEDIKPDDIVYQVRFTKEIFRDYEEYLKRINLYRQRVWTCKVTCKTNLTYEEALVSEQRATEKIQHFPEELMAPVLHLVQYSTLNLKDLVNTISDKLQENCLEGIELYAKREQFFGLCKVLKVLDSKDEKKRYEVGWLDKCKNVTSTSIISANDLIRKKLPFSQNVLKSFIRESTSQSAPWVICDKLAQKYEIPTEPPEELQDEYFICDGLLSRSMTVVGTAEANYWKKKKKRVGGWTQDGFKKRMPNFDPDAKRTQKHIKYPIDDLLVQPGKDDPLFSDRPPATNDFSVPMECVGDLLMVWDFFISFGKFLHLSPFPLEDLENAICHKNSNLNLIVEIHAAIFQLLFREGEYFGNALNKKRNSKVTAVNWGEFLSYFLETDKVPELSSYLGIIRRGHYGILDARAKIGILRQLVIETLTTQAIRQQLDECVAQLHTISSVKSQKAQEEAKGKTEVKLATNQACSLMKELSGEHLLENGRNGSNCLASCATEKNGVIQNKGTLKVYVSRRKLVQENWERSQEAPKQERMDAKIVPEILVDSTSADQYRKHLGKRKRKSKKRENKAEDKKEALKHGMDKRFIRTDPMGKDRNYNRYWFFQYDGRIFVESSDSMMWGYYSTKQEVDLLMGSLNPKGERERALHKQLEKHYLTLCKAVEKRSKNTVVADESELRRSERVRSRPKSTREASFLRYVNKWKEI